MEDECYCCGRRAHPLGPLRMTDSGWRCGDDFCRTGTVPVEPPRWATGRAGA